MITDYITHDEAMIQNFIEHPEYAEDLLAAVREDGNEYERQRVQSWYDEAKTRTYWNNLIENAERTAQHGYNLDTIISNVTKALNILQAAATAQLRTDSIGA